MSTFEEAAQMAKDQLPESLPNEDMLALYALFKQATAGDCNTDRPGIFDQKGRYKWDAWNGKKGMSQEDAKKQYIQLVHDLKAKHGTR
mmetsp:Transcript_12692/g.34630  ORF Transcript_12692/g.34630 Transcript_12692/m.34630 type:complete len:88 (-) Transcript_12692:285-548(-)|eukprot:CAMPEP_0202350830 /NCGR_PEP_ID=MMETSP1126-20121109/7741_1 /ASSEMBLY_ACC=CAM_ASM_000457 /TAXON_ID=3047 /ORGANISM="Dunaliella tertiolecta, Strain CCMP1320" /LENGTH=87 /DNA_ID=CAMNT_0048942871 /DNA_START=47 /DNA_END=310 /DNA_ORIENTATION=+